MTGPGVGPAHGARQLLPGGYRDLQDTAAEAQAFAEAMSPGDAVAEGEGELLSGFEITDLRRFITQLRMCELAEDFHGELVQRALIAGYVRAALDSHDRRAAAAAAAPDDPGDPPL